MADAPAPVVKHYLSDKPSLSMSVKVEEDGKSVIETILFVGGKFSTNKVHEQEAIESSSLFASGHVRIAPSPRQVLVAAVAKAQGAVDAASAELKKAQAALAAFDAPAAPAK